MSLIDDHENNLAIILEDPEKFGVSITLIDTNDVEYEFIGQANNISRHFSVDTGADVVGERSNVTIRLSTFLIKTNVDIEDIKTDIENWKVIVLLKSGFEKTYIIEEGGIFPDFVLGYGIITIFLTEVEIS